MSLQRKGAFYTGQYRNVFRDYGYTEIDVQERLQQTWQELFYGPEDTKIYYELGEDKAYLLDTGNNDVRTEGMSYGMMMCVQMDKQDEFDKLWRFSKEFMQIRRAGTKTTSPGIRVPTASESRKGPRRTAKSFLRLPCSSQAIDGAIVPSRSIIVNKRGRSCAHASIRERTGKQEIQCGMRRRS